MAFIGAYWWLWLILTFLSGGYVIYYVIERSKKLSTAVMNMADPFRRPVSETERVIAEQQVRNAIATSHHGFGKLIIAGFICTIFTLLFFLSIVVNLIAFIKA